MRLETMKPNPDDLQRVLVRLKEWADRKMKVQAHLDFGFTTLASICYIEALSDQAFALTEEGGGRIYSVIPVLGSHASLEDLEGIAGVIIISEDQRSELYICEAKADQDVLMARMASKMIQ